MSFLKKKKKKKKSLRTYLSCIKTKVAIKFLKKKKKKKKNFRPKIGLALKGLTSLSIIKSLRLIFDLLSDLAL